jgi:hypothetical protein
MSRSVHRSKCRCLAASQLLLSTDHSAFFPVPSVQVFALSREALDASCERFPAAQRTIDKAAARIRLQRALLLYLCDKQGTVPRSFVPQRMASGTSCGHTTIAHPRHADAARATKLCPCQHSPRATKAHSARAHDRHAHDRHVAALMR